MTDVGYRSLDYLAAAAAQKITEMIGAEVGKPGNGGKRKQVDASDLENLTTKTLGILQEQGVYAMFLFLLSRSGSKTGDQDVNAEQRAACEIVAQLFQLLGTPELKPLGIAYQDTFTWEYVNAHKRSRGRDENKVKGLLDHLVQSGGLMDNLDTLFLVRDLYEQTLIYTRFGAKAAEKEADNT